MTPPSPFGLMCYSKKLGRPRINNLFVYGWSVLGSRFGLLILSFIQWDLSFSE